MKRDQNIEENPLGDFLGKYIGNWAEPIIKSMPNKERDLIYTLKNQWWDKQFEIEECKNAFLINGLIAEQDDIVSEIRTMINNYAKAKRESAKADKKTI